MPTISVILPMYNGAAYVDSAIRSILDQTFVDFELIIIDDCSTDASSEIAKRYTAADSRVFYYRNDKNLKLPLSLNRGFSLAKGQYLTWTSCDNNYLPQAFQTMFDALEKESDLGLVYASMQIIDENNKTIECLEAGPSADIIFRNVVGACFLYRRSVAGKIGLYDPALFLCEDYEYWLRIASVTPIKPILACLYQYRKHKKSLSHNHEREVIAKGIGVQKRYYPVFVKTRKQAALFYAYLRSRDIYNPIRQFYLLFVFFYNPWVFCKEIQGLIMRRFKP